MAKHISKEDGGISEMFTVYLLLLTIKEHSV
jgi:hypothetical protein